MPTLQTHELFALTRDMPTRTAADRLCQHLNSHLHSGDRIVADEILHIAMEIEPRLPVLMALVMLAAGADPALPTRDRLIAHVLSQPGINPRTRELISRMRDHD